MSTYISMLRGINVSGQKIIRKDELIKLYQSLGFEQVATYLQSGNVVFSNAEVDATALAAKIEAQIQAVFGFDVAVCVRSVTYFEQILANNPFAKRPKGNAEALYVTFLYQAPDEAKVSKLETPAGETAEFALGDQAVYLFVPDGYGRTKLSNTFFERKLGVQATTRNWNTVNALYQMGKERE